MSLMDLLTAGLRQPACAQLERQWRTPLLSACSPRLKAFSDGQHKLLHPSRSRGVSLVAAVAQQRTSQPQRLDAAAKLPDAAARLQPLTAAAASTAAEQQASFRCRALSPCCGVQPHADVQHMFSVQANASSQWRHGLATMLASVAMVVATLFGTPTAALAEPMFGGGFGGAKPATLEMKVGCIRQLACAANLLRC